MKYYISNNDEKLGPYTVDELKNIGIKENTKIWTEELGQWTEAANIESLKDIIAGNPLGVSGTINNKTTAESQENINVNDKYFGYKLASKWERFIATLIEVLLILIPVLIITEGRYLKDWDYLSIRNIEIDVIIAIIVGGLMYPVWSGHIGHKIFGIKVISKTSGKDIKNPLLGIIREVSKFILSYLVIPVIWILWDKDKQNLYDKISNTIVVKKKSGLVKSFIHWIFKMFISIVIIIVSFLMITTYVYIDGIPSFSDYVIERLPENISLELGKELRNEVLTHYDMDDYKTDKANEFVKKLNLDKKIKIYVIKSHKFNAFALPEKYIFIYSEVFDKLNSYEEFAGLIAHEYTHIVKNHGLRSIGRSLGYELFTSVFFSKDLKKQIFDKSNMLITNKYSRAFEKEADLNAIEILHSKKIDVNGVLSLLKILRKIEPRRQLNDKFSDHPNTIERIEYVEEEIEKMDNNYIEHDDLKTLFREIKENSE